MERMTRLKLKGAKLHPTGAPSPPQAARRGREKSAELAQGAERRAAGPLCEVARIGRKRAASAPAKSSIKKKRTDGNGCKNERHGAGTDSAKPHNTRGANIARAPARPL